MANNGFYLDDNGKALTHPQGLRPAWNATGSGIVVATTGGATAEVDITALRTASASQSNGSRLMVRVANIGSNPALVAFGAAGAAATFTSNDNMLLMAPNSVENFALASVDVSFYHLQVTGANTVQVTALG